MPRYADLTGYDAYPAEEPQKSEDLAMDRFMHDEPDYDPSGANDYNFFYGNGQLHVSPHHDHSELSGHAGVPSDHHGPMAAGFVHVDGGRATWHVQGNVALSGFSRILKDYTKQVGWAWGGLTDLDGQPVDDSFAPKKSMVMRDNETGEERTFVVQGKIANPAPWMTEEHFRELHAAGYKVAEYPGGSNMTDDTMMKNHRPTGEDYELYNNGDPLQPAPIERNPSETPTGTFRCPECDRIFPNWGDYLLHRKSEEPERDFDDDGHFPEMDMDAPLKPHYHEREPTVMPLASVKEARRVEGFDLYAGLWGYDSDDFIHYGAFRNGEPLGYATVRPDDDGATVIMVHSMLSGRGVGTALLRGLQQRYPKLTSKAASASGERLMRRLGWVEAEKGLWKWAQGQEPKDMIDDPLPFVYDIGNDTITVGYPGTRTSDIPGTFTPGGIVEGEYAPGGKVTITTDTNMPWTARHVLDLWANDPVSKHMQVTGLELLQNGKTIRLARQITARDLGDHVRQVAATYPAVWTAYKALSKAGGKVYAVGGAPRDALLQKPINDVDLMVTGLPPAAVHNILDKLPGGVDLTGKSFGVYRYHHKGDEVEIALPRKERSTGDRRVDFDVTVDHNMPVEDDLLRRDFTINSIAVDLDNGHVVDPYKGADAIANNTLSTTHPASFREDPTRLVRALVMHSRYGFNPDERTRAEMEQHAPAIMNESSDALRPILDKLFKANNPAAGIRLAHDTGLLRHLFPEVEAAWDFDQKNKHHNYPLGQHLLNVLEGVTARTGDPDLRLAALLHDIGKPASAWEDPATGQNHYYRGPQGQGDDHEIVGGQMAEDRLRHLSYPVTRIKRIKHLINHHMFPAFSTGRGARKFMHRVGDDHADDLLTLREADMSGKGQTAEEMAERTAVEYQRTLVEQARTTGAPTSTANLSVNGNDLIQMGVKPGPKIGEILRRLTDDVLDDPRLNDRNALLERASEYVNAIPG